MLPFMVTIPVPVIWSLIVRAPVPATVRFLLPRETTVLDPIVVRAVLLSVRVLEPETVKRPVLNVRAPVPPTVLLAARVTTFPKVYAVLLELEIVPPLNERVLVPKALLLPTNVVLLGDNVVVPV